MKLDTDHLDLLIETCAVRPGKKISLKKDYETIFKHSFSKTELSEALSKSVILLSKEQDKLYAQNSYALLVVLQAMDAAGKDSTIKHVMSGVNPQGCQVHSFKQPSTEELDHDFLWRCNKRLPERGCIGIFNRSYYEEVLISKVHREILLQQQLPKHIRNSKNLFERRYEDINAYERYLTNNGIIVIKCFLNISREEQKRRFLDRIDLPEKNWKFSMHDVDERKLWSKYMDAYEECFNQTSTSWAPWLVIPADYKPMARLIVAHVIYNTLEKLKLEYPTVTKIQREQLVEAKAILSSE